MSKKNQIEKYLLKLLPDCGGKFRQDYFYKEVYRKIVEIKGNEDSETPTADSIEGADRDLARDLFVLFYKQGFVQTRKEMKDDEALREYARKRSDEIYNKLIKEESPNEFEGGKRSKSKIPNDYSRDLCRQRILSELEHTKRARLSSDSLDKKLRRIEVIEKELDLRDREIREIVCLDEMIESLKICDTDPKKVLLSNILRRKKGLESREYIHSSLEDDPVLNGISAKLNQVKGKKREEFIRSGKDFEFTKLLERRRADIEELIEINSFINFYKNKGQSIPEDILKSLSLRKKEIDIASLNVKMLNHFDDLLVDPLDYISMYVPMTLLQFEDHKRIQSLKNAHYELVDHYSRKIKGYELKLREFVGLKMYEDGISSDSMVKEYFSKDEEFISILVDYENDLSVFLKKQEKILWSISTYIYVKFKIDCSILKIQNDPEIEALLSLVDWIPLTFEDYIQAVYCLYIRMNSLKKSAA